MAPQRALEEIESLFKYSSRCKTFVAVDDLMPSMYPKRVFNFLDTPADVQILYEMRVNYAEDDIQAMSRAGIKLVQPGIEALSTRALRLMRKGTTVFQNLRFLMNCLTNNVTPLWALLVGIPGEDSTLYDDCITNIPLLTHLPPPAGSIQIHFLRYSDYFNYADRYHLQLQPAQFYKYDYPFIEETLRGIAYQFEDKNYEKKHFILFGSKLEKLNELISSWKNRWSHGKSYPKLVFISQNGSDIVYDTRTDEEIVHEINSLGKLLLNHLVKPQRVQDIAIDLDHVSHSTLEKEVHLLHRRGLLFHEDDYFMSLVLSHDIQYKRIEKLW